MDRDLYARAKAVRDRAHAPYSRFHVGAALRTEAGTVHAGLSFLPHLCQQVLLDSDQQPIILWLAPLPVLPDRAGGRLAEVAAQLSLRLRHCQPVLFEQGRHRSLPERSPVVQCLRG